MAKIRILRTTKKSEPTLDFGQPYIDATSAPGRLYIGQGNGSLTNSEISVSKADDADYATNASYATNAGVATQLSTERSVITDLGSNTAAAFDGTKDIEAGVKGILGVNNGGTGNEDGVVAKAGFATEADSLTDYMTFMTQLNSESEGLIKEGGKYCGIGVTGVLPVSHGGTGGSTYTITGGETSFDTSDYCAIATGLSNTQIDKGNYNTECSSTMRVFCVDKFVVLLMTTTTSIGNDSAMRFKYGDWVNDFNKNNPYGITIPSFTIVNTQVTARIHSAQVTLGYYNYTAICGVYVDEDNKYLYVGQDVYSAADGWFVTIFGMTS